MMLVTCHSSTATLNSLLFCDEYKMYWINSSFLVFLSFLPTLSIFDTKNINLITFFTMIFISFYIIFNWIICTMIFSARPVFNTLNNQYLTLFFYTIFFSYLFIFI